MKKSIFKPKIAKVAKFEPFYFKNRTFFLKNFGTVGKPTFSTFKKCKKISATLAFFCVKKFKKQKN